MTSFTWTIIIIHFILGMLCAYYCIPDRKTIENENQFKRIKIKMGLCTEDTYVYSQRYIENIEYEKIFKKAFPNYSNTYYSLIISPIVVFPMFLYIFSLGINIHCIGSIFNILTIIIIIPFIIFFTKFLISILYPKNKKVTEEIIKLRPLFEISSYVYCYCSSFLIIISVLCLLNYTISISKPEEFVVNVTGSYPLLYDQTGLFEVKRHNAICIKPSIYGIHTLETNYELQRQAKQGDKTKVIVKKGLFGAKFINSNNIAIIHSNSDKQE